MSTLVRTIRKFDFWDLAPWLAWIGIAYGTYELVAADGWLFGIAAAGLSGLAGYLSVEMLWPLWVGTKR